MNLNCSVMKNENIWKLMTWKYFRISVLSGNSSWKQFFLDQCKRSRGGPIEEFHFEDKKWPGKVRYSYKISILCSKAHSQSG